MNDVAPFITLSSLFAVGFGIVLLGDQMTSRVIAGGMLTLIGVTVIAMRGARVSKLPERGRSKSSKAE